MEGRDQVRTDRRGGLLGRLRSAPPAPSRPSVDDLVRSIRTRDPKADLARVQRAYAVANAAHEGQRRMSGEDYVEHPVAVARNLVDIGLDTTTVVAALLHDTVEDTPLTLTDVREGFGDEVASLVDGLTKLDALTFRSREQEQAENVRKMIIAMSGDIRVLLIKLADRLHNMRTLDALDPERQRRIASETLSVYAPLADRLGVQRWKWELEDLAFKTLHPGPYREIVSLVERRREEREAYVDGLLGAARQRLREAGVKAEVQGRPKHLYSIYEKMVLGGKEFNEIHDLVGIRILVETIRDAYAALGAIHALWRPVPGRFKDYVAMPKENMYQSLHTTVLGPGGRPLEVQIRTRDMHRTAEYGIAAHWRYKGGGERKTKDAADLAWLAQMLDWLRDAADPSDVMEGLRIDLYGDQVFVFTPKGDVANLPAGATPVDFAYGVHTEVGHRTIGAKVNGKLVPLDYQLRTGDTVEVLTGRSPDEGPSQDWLTFVVSPRARTKIRQWFTRERREDALEEGRDALQRLMRKQGVPIRRLATEESLRSLAAEMSFPDLDALYVALGEGQVSPQSVVARLTRNAADVDEGVADIPLARPVRLPESTSGVVVQGDEDVWVRLARCCTPVPGDAILGFITRGRGVSVHRTDCPNAAEFRAEPDRLIDVSWRPGRGTSFSVAVQVEALDRTRLLSDVAAVLSDHSVNILSATTTVRKDRTTSIRFTFQLADIAHLEGLLAAVRGVEGVFEAFRVVPR
ncbi:MAG: RelA/SpoT family protein [Actinomycetota bacterium]